MAGFNGTIDWVGYSVGKGDEATVGYLGILDFTGLSVGRGAAAPAPSNAFFVGFMNANIGGLR